MAFEAQRTEIIEIARRLLDEGAVVLGFADGGDGKCAPRFFRAGDDLAAMRWDAGCAPNLAALLPGRKGKLAIVAKPCDARAVAMYVAEGQLKREEIQVIGVECPGMAGPDGSPVPGCAECTVRVPPIWDELVRGGTTDAAAQEGTPGIDSPGTAQNAPDAAAAEGVPGEDSGERMHSAPEGAPGAYSLERFQNELKKCMMCFACRQACYGCYCKTCFVERGLPDWLPPDVDLGAKAMFHMGRAMHLAGRCVECGACERACPSGVKVRYLIMELTRMGKELYGPGAGLDERPSALTAFDMGDPEVGFLGGE